MGLRWCSVERRFLSGLNKMGMGTGLAVGGGGRAQREENLERDDARWRGLAAGVLGGGYGESLGNCHGRARRQRLCGGRARRQRLCGLRLASKDCGWEGKRGEGSVASLCISAPMGVRERGDPRVDDCF